MKQTVEFKEKSISARLNDSSLKSEQETKESPCTIDRGATHELGTAGIFRSHTDDCGAPDRDLGMKVLRMEDAANMEGKKRRRLQRSTAGERAGKGLRHFSLKVCEKVESKGRTSYSEVADELVAEYSCESVGSNLDLQYDEKNIRRRVYDALNVLEAMNIISKEKKEIRWVGLPHSGPSKESILQEEINQVQTRLDEKEAQLQELQEQVLGLERLISRNEESDSKFATTEKQNTGVYLPFTLVQTQSQATVEVMISEDMQTVKLDFGSSPFELHEDNYVLRAMGLFDRPDPQGTPAKLGFLRGRNKNSLEKCSSTVSAVENESNFSQKQEHAE